jgi:hypothetical protein
VHLVDDAAVQLGSGLGRGLVDPADDLRGRPCGEVSAARIDALGREREMEPVARLQPALLEQRLEDVARRPGVGRRLEHDEMAGMEVGGDRTCRALDVRQIGIALGGKRRGDGDHDRIRPRDHAEIGCGAHGARLDERLQPLRGDVADVALAAVDRVHDVLEDVHENDLLACLGEGLGVRHADVAGADHSDVVAGVRAHSGREAYRAAATRSAARPSP